MKARVVTSIDELIKVMKEEPKQKSFVFDEYKNEKLST
jgi:hypothetical protein